MATPEFHFGSFRDRSESRFHRAAGLRPEQTWLAIQQRIGKALADLRKVAWGKPLRMEPERIRRWHGAIFKKLFPYEGGRFRQAHEDAHFGVELEAPYGSGARRLIGARPEEIHRELERVCDRFNDAVASLVTRRSLSTLEVCRAAAGLYGGIIRVHPFVDGNHRAGFLVLSTALWMFELPNVYFVEEEDVRDHDAALTPALLPEAQDSEPFAELLVTRIEKQLEAEL